MADETLLETINLTKIFESGVFRKRRVVAVNNVNIKIREGEVLSLVGESGSGKTTLSRIILRLLKPTSGKVLYKGRNIFDLNDEECKYYWREVQGIFQDPYATYNPIHKVDHALNLCFNLLDKQISEKERIEIINEALKNVGLNPEEVLGKYPHQLSGGQRQRIMIARCLIIKPRIIIADEPITMLDASLRARILKILLEAREKSKSSLVFITHDLGFACYGSNRILVMRKGKIVEEGAPEQLLTSPKHPYTKKLLEDIPTLYQKWSDI